MNEALEALIRIKSERPQYFSGLYDIDMWREDIKTIETELKRKEIFDTLDKLPTPQLCYNESNDFIEIVDEDEFVFASKDRLEALAILKETLDIKLYEATSLDKTNVTRYYIMIGNMVSYQLKNKEEYDLLREVLL